MVEATQVTAAPRRAPRSRGAEASVPSYRNAYSSASNANGNIALWQPTLRSADGDILRDAGKLRARARDLERNHPYAQQAVRVSRLGTIGKKLRYSCRPDYRFLGIDQDEAVRWAQEFERLWESYAHGINFSIDAGRRMDFTQHMALAHDRDFTDGESLITAEFNPNRRWKTCFQAVDVDRLSNPNGRPETNYLRAGVQMDEFSAPVGYFIRDGHPGDFALIGSRNMTWSYVLRETDWGRPVVLHTFEQLRPGQTRGVTAFASTIAAMKMGQEYAESALQQAILQSSYAAVLTSQLNYRDALEVISTMPPGEEAMSIRDLAEENLEAALAHHEQIKLRFQGAQIPVLWPGEELKMVQPGTGAVALGDFQKHMTKSYAAGTGTDPIAVSQDYSDVNYSSAKMAAATSTRAYEMRRERLTRTNALPMVSAFLEEAVFLAGFKLPKGLKPADFFDARDALIKGTFLTQGAPNLDPLKEANALTAEMMNGTATLQDACAEKGLDHLEVMDQQAAEMKARADRGLPPIGPAAMLPPPAEDEGDKPKKKGSNDG